VFLDIDPLMSHDSAIVTITNEVFGERGRERDGETDERTVTLDHKTSII